MREKVTIQEIADLAGVSKFAVSRALAGKDGVSATTREMIFKVAGQLGYFKNNEPKRFSGELQDHDDRKWAGTIVVLFPNIRYQNKESVYWGAVFDGISTRLNQKGIDILTLTEPSSDHVFSLLKPEAIQGIITVGTISTPILLEIGRLDIPVVMVDHSDPAFLCDTVFMDNFRCMQNLMTKLVSKGYRKFQFIGNITDAHSFIERWLAYRTTLESFGIVLNQDPLLIGQEADDIYKLVPQMTLTELPEVFVCANDISAQFLIDELGKRNISVPVDCAVTGFDNTCDTHPIHGTVDVNKELLGMRAVDQMLWRIVNRSSAYEKKLIYGEIIIRDQYAYAAEIHREI
ncbi:LacI family DNA-binding transcriptional regulator [Paenibacillus abyssi]|uniref:LacI family transcriptional regulator n=1 Tax=Paenibacillus abyssi TaxID=1340531 RepID=A0A917G5T3_9BACL|nr:LacI family DNA-binding transcriptional regulator [Paenibacillus abyssi]GGG23785.1 LacI family transcriptional regulator [Paenibacillus abyssi]